MSEIEDVIYNLAIENDKNREIKIAEFIKKYIYIKEYPDGSFCILAKQDIPMEKGGKNEL